MPDILVAILIGLITGYIAALISKTQNKPVVCLAVGVMGGFVGKWYFILRDISFGSSLLTIVISAAAGAIVLLAVFGAIWQIVKLRKKAE